MTQAIQVAQYGSSGVSLGFKNRIINGAMVIDQRNGGASVTLPSGTTRTLDRWTLYSAESSKYSCQQNAGSVTPPAGFVNYLGITSLAATTPATEDVYVVRQYIEGFNIADLAWGTANAKTITLSFWVRSSLTGTFGGALKNGSGDYSYPFTYTISQANTWEYKTLTVPGSTSGTWLTTNGLGLSLVFSLGSGSFYAGSAGSWSNNSYFTATGSTNVVGTNGATWYITGVQVEVGSLSTTFEYRDYGNELRMCQRYYESGSANPSCFADQFGNAVWEGFYKVDKRAAGTFTYNDATGNTGKIARWFTGSYSSNVTPSGLSADGTKRFSGNITGLSAGTLVKVGFNWFQDSEI